MRFSLKIGPIRLRLPSYFPKLFIKYPFCYVKKICIIDKKLHKYKKFQIQKYYISKLKNAASLIILQINELQVRVQEIQTYVTDKGLNFGAFYDSLPLMDIDYWSKYKHLFIRKMGSKSYNDFNKFYQYIARIQEQQELLRNLQKNYFFLKQNAISNSEFNYIQETLKEVFESAISESQLQELLNLFSKLDNSEANKKIIINLLTQLKHQTSNFDIERFWKIYNNKRHTFITITDKNEALTTYIPQQILNALQGILKQYALLEITGSEGYKKLCRISQLF